MRNSDAGFILVFDRHLLPSGAVHSLSHVLSLLTFIVALKFLIYRSDVGNERKLEYCKEEYQMISYRGPNCRWFSSFEKNILKFYGSFQLILITYPPFKSSCLIS